MLSRIALFYILAFSLLVAGCKGTVAVASSTDGVEQTDTLAAHNPDKSHSTKNSVANADPVAPLSNECRAPDSDAPMLRVEFPVSSVDLTYATVILSCSGHARDDAGPIYSFRSVDGIAPYRLSDYSPTFEETQADITKIWVTTEDVSEKRMSLKLPKVGSFDSPMTYEREAADPEDWYVAAKFFCHAEHDWRFVFVQDSSTNETCKWAIDVPKCDEHLASSETVAFSAELVDCK